jgi:hypothetical protein
VPGSSARMVSLRVTSVPAGSNSRFIAIHSGQVVNK